MEKRIRDIVNNVIEKCIELEKSVLLEDGSIKEEYQETLVDRYLDILMMLEKEISVVDLGICIENESDKVKRFYIAYYLLDERMFRQLNKELGTVPGWKAEARIRLYMMYLKVFREVLFLLANGYSDCALARTRTLYELGVYISIINKNTDVLAERFCRHCNVQSLKMAKAISTEERINKIEEFIDQFNYEKGYKKDNGWARVLLPHINNKSNIQFRDLISLTDYNQYENMYKMACNFVHGSLFSSLESLDSAKEQRGKTFWNTSPSDEGIEEVIHFLKIYIVMFVSEYTRGLKDKTIFENMLTLFLLGKEILQDGNE